MVNSWMTQFWLVCTQLSVLSQLLNVKLAPWLKASSTLTSVSRVLLWILMECLCIWFLLRCLWYHTVPLASLYESFCVLATFMCVVNILMFAKLPEGSNSWLSIGISLALAGIILFVNFALPVGMQQSDGPPQSLRAPWLLIHVSMMIISYAFLTLGSLVVLGGIYAIWYALHTKLQS